MDLTSTRTKAIAAWVVGTFVIGTHLSNPDPESTALYRMIGAWIGLGIESVLAVCCLSVAANDAE